LWGIDVPAEEGGASCGVSATMREGGINGGYDRHASDYKAMSYGNIALTGKTKTGSP